MTVTECAGGGGPRRLTTSPTPAIGIMQATSNSAPPYSLLICSGVLFRFVPRSASDGQWPCFLYYIVWCCDIVNTYMLTHRICDSECEGVTSTGTKCWGAAGRPSPRPGRGLRPGRGASNAAVCGKSAILRARARTACAAACPVRIRCGKRRARCAW